MAAINPSPHERDASTSSLDLLPDTTASQGERRQSNNMSSIPPAILAVRTFPKRSAWMGVIARHTLGIAFLLITVSLFTASNFLASTIFADDSYSKPYFVTYLNVSSFSILLLFTGLRYLWKHHDETARGSTVIRRSYPGSPTITGDDRVALLKDDEGDASNLPPSSPRSEGPPDGIRVNLSGIDNSSQNNLERTFNVRDTARLGFEFGVLWFFANYFTTASLTYTSVGSATILFSTSGIWTLIIGTFANVENATPRKIGGVFASLLGIFLTSLVDVFGDADQTRGSFPHKSHIQIAVGDVLALVSAILYGLYTTLMKKRAGSEARINVLLFFGFVGFFNMITLFPGLFILHYTGVERFELPPTSRITAIVLINMAICFVSDICWAYAMLLTSPLVVTVGLNLTIPLSLVGQVFLNAQIPSLTYWLGAAIVFVAFILVNHESKKVDEKAIDSEPRMVHEPNLGNGGSRNSL